MKFSFGRVVFLVIGLCLYSEKCRADAALNLAAAFLEAGNYYEAVTECKRFVCFNSEDSSLSTAYFLMGTAYRGNEEWGPALLAINRAITLTSDDSLKAERRIELGVTRLASGDYSGAEYELLRVTAFEARASIKQKAALFLGVCRTFRHDWSGARDAFGGSILEIGKRPPRALDSILDARQRPAVKSEKTARWLSAFIPGSGQIYAGDIRAGVNAFGLNSALGYLFVKSVVDRRYDDAVIGYLTPLLRYYGGNLYRAGQAAENHNARLNRRYVERLLSIVRAEVENAETSSRKPGP